MKKHKIFITVGMAFLITATGMRMAANAAPGDSADPLVSKSYVDSRINEILDISGLGAVLDTEALVEEILRKLEFAAPEPIPNPMSEPTDRKSVV